MSAEIRRAASDVPRPTEDGAGHVAPVPHITLQAFCETPELASVVQAAAGDRRMAKAQVRTHMGGASAAVGAFSESNTPNVVVVEQAGDRAAFLAHIDSLAEVCDAGTRVVVVSHLNDIVLYRELVRRGVSEYIMAPVDVVGFVRAVSELFSSGTAAPLGRVIAFTGARGGVGASTLCHNVAWTIGKRHGLGVVLGDLDLPFGTVGLDFNQDPAQGIAEAAFSADRLDATLLERLLTKCADNLSLLAAPATLDRVADLEERTFEPVIDLLRGLVPAVVLDVPHAWSGWARRTLATADEVVIVAEPDLANLRNAKNLYDAVRAGRPNDSLPRLVLNKVGMPKRPEIGRGEFAKAIGAEVATSLAFDAASFGTAANNGQMIGEVASGAKAADALHELALSLLGRTDTRRARKGSGLIAPLAPFLGKLARKRA